MGIAHTTIRSLGIGRDLTELAEITEIKMASEFFQWPGQRPDDPAHAMLAAYLVMDIQHNPEWAGELADRIADVKSGNLPGWERIGNAYRLELIGRCALIEDLVEEDSSAQKVPLEELSLAVNAWIEAISDGH